MICKHTNFSIYFMCLSISHTHMWTFDILSNFRVQKAADTLELELHKVVRQHVGAGT